MYSSLIAQSSDVSNTCSLPQCLEANTSIPNELSIEETPQFIIVTFDDTINRLRNSNKTLSGPKNSNIEDVYYYQMASGDILV